MTEEKNDFLCYVCLFILVVIAAFCIIGEKEDKPQKVEIVKIQKGAKSVK